MWTDILIFLPMLLALIAVGAVIWLRRQARKGDAAPQAEQRAGGPGGPTGPV